MVGKDLLDGAAVNRALIRLEPRGPDDRGVWRGDGAVMGMTRLAIVDLSGGHQPMFDPSGRYCIVFNGEIYNHVELREELQRLGHTFKTHSDTEVLLALFCELGEAALEKLNGIFAFAIYDSVAKRLFLARDRLGIKPLYVRHDGANLYFASGGAVLDDWLSLGIDQAAVLSYLTWSYVPEPQSIYSGATKLGAGRCLWFDDRGLSERVYWRPEDRLGEWRGTVAQAKEQLDFLLADSLRLQVRSDVPIGIFLSGGIDSSAVLHYARRVINGRIRTFTIAFEEKAGQDAAMARLMAQAVGADYCEISVGVGSTGRLLAESIAAMDEPFADTAFLPSLEISRVARSEGIKVLLAGGGGDEIFGGYSRHWRAKPGRIRWFAEAIEAIGGHRLGNLVSRHIRSDRLKRLLSPECTLVAEISGANFGFLHECLADGRHYTTMLARLAALHCRLKQEQAVAGYHYVRMLADVRNYLVNNVLAITDQSTMGASVEGRVPLLDHRLVEFCFSLPPAINLIGGRPKGLLRKTLLGMVPNAVLERPKEGFNAPARSWLRRGLEDNLERLVHHPAPVLGEILDGAALARWVAEPRLRRAAAHTLYSLVVLNDWWHAHKS